MKDLVIFHNIGCSDIEKEWNEKLNKDVFVPFMHVIRFTDFSFNESEFLNSESEQKKKYLKLILYFLKKGVHIELDSINKDPYTFSISYFFEVFPIEEIKIKEDLENYVEYIIAPQIAIDLYNDGDFKEQAEYRFSNTLFEHLNPPPFSIDTLIGAEFNALSVFDDRLKKFYYGKRSDSDTDMYEYKIEYEEDGDYTVIKVTLNKNAYID